MLGLRRAWPCGATRTALFLVASASLLGLFLVGDGPPRRRAGLVRRRSRRALDGRSPPLRNVHKFDPVIRLPLVLGLAFLLERARCAASTGTPHPTRRARGPCPSPASSVLAVIAVVGAADPRASRAGWRPPGAIAEVPGYWEEAGAWLDDRGDEGVGAAVAGRRGGPVRLGLAQRRAARVPRRGGPLRGAVQHPLRATGQHPDARRDRGAPDPGTARRSGWRRTCARAGVQYLVVRNDVIKAPDIPDTVLVHQALDESPGIEPAGRASAPSSAVGAHLGTGEDRNVINGGWQTNYPAIEIYEVATGGPGAVAADELPVVVGGPEYLLDLADAGMLDEQPTVLATDADAEVAPTGPGHPHRRLPRPRALLRPAPRRLLRDHAAGRRPTLVNADKDLYVNEGDERWRTTARSPSGRESRDARSSAMSDADAPAAPGRASPPSPRSTVTSDDPWVSQPGTSRRPELDARLSRARATIAQVTLSGGAARTDASRPCASSPRPAPREEFDLGPTERVP